MKIIMKSFESLTYLIYTEVLLVTRHWSIVSILVAFFLRIIIIRKYVMLRKRMKSVNLDGRFVLKIKYKTCHSKELELRYDRRRLNQSTCLVLNHNNRVLPQYFQNVGDYDGVTPLDTNSHSLMLYFVSLLVNHCFHSGKHLQIKVTKFGRK